MINCTCLVQAGQIPANSQAALKASIDAFTQRAFDAPAEITWIEVPEQSGFTADAPSTSAIVSMRSHVALEQSHRVSLLKELCDLWMEETKCSLNEIVSVISNPQ